MLERLNGDEKGDAIVSVRGYEPLWTRFTPSYELKNVYFAAGKADIEKREARLFEKRDYVFDILGGNQAKEEEKILDLIEQREEEEAKQEEDEKQEEKERIKTLDAEWDKLVAEAHEKMRVLSEEALDEEDAIALQKAALENKLLLLTAIIENYDEEVVKAKIREASKYLQETYNKLHALQKDSVR